MVLIDHVGFGGRERDVWLYFWDTRDGADWSGWWITPDFVGNNEFFFHACSQAITPDKVPVGEWRSHHVEEMQLKRKLEVGFRLDSEAGGHIGKAYALAESAFTFPVFLDTDVFMCQGWWEKLMQLTAENPQADVFWTDDGYV